MELSQVQASSPESVNTQNTVRNDTEHKVASDAKESSPQKTADRVDLSQKAQELQQKETKEEDVEEIRTEKNQNSSFKQTQDLHEKKMEQKEQDKSQEIYDDRYQNKQPDAYGYAKQQDTAAFTGNNIDEIA